MDERLGEIDVIEIIKENNNNNNSPAKVNNKALSNSSQSSLDKDEFKIPVLRKKVTKLNSLKF